MIQEEIQIYQNILLSWILVTENADEFSFQLGSGILVKLSSICHVQLIIISLLMF